MEYLSPFDNWYSYSTVHKPLPDFTCETGLVLFPPELVPGVGHPLVDKLGNDTTRRLMMRKLESYNAFTEKLEYKAVMAASIKLAQNPQAFGLSEQAGREARLIVTDESHHAYVAIELIKGIPGFSELPPLAPSQPPFLRGLEELEKGLPTEFADDLLVAFVAISETLITSILRGIPRDLRVVSAVRNTVRDHCLDEARHHSYFVYVVHQHWASSVPDRREVLGPLYAKLIRLFLDPDIDLCRAWLLEAGLDPHDAEVVLRDYYSPERLAASVRADSFPTLKLMERVGILDHPTARPAFVKQKLIDYLKCAAQAARLSSAAWCFRNESGGGRGST